MQTISLMQIISVQINFNMILTVHCSISSVKFIKNRRVQNNLHVTYLSLSFLCTRLTQKTKQEIISHISKHTGCKVH